VRHCQSRARLENKSALDANTFSKDTVGSNPAIDPAAIVADLKPIAPDRFYEVKIFSTSHFAKYDVSDGERGTIDWDDRAKVTRFDTALHRRPTRSKRNSFSSAELLNVMRRPAHLEDILTSNHA
jgi:hypothetical protein